MPETQELDLNAVEQFADHLENAMTLMRRYRSIVLSERFPDWLVERLKSFGLRHEPCFDVDYYDSEFVDAGLLVREDVPGDPEDVKPSLTLAEIRLQVQDIDKYSERQRVVATFLETTDLDQAEAASLAICQRLIREEQGCNTPFNDFFHKLVRYSLTEALTPNDIREMLPEFEEDWSDMLPSVRQFQADHPNLFRSAKTEQLTPEPEKKPDLNEDVMQITALSIAHAHGIESLARELRSMLPVTHAKREEAVSAKG